MDAKEVDALLRVVYDSRPVKVSRIRYLTDPDLLENPEWWVGEILLRTVRAMLTTSKLPLRAGRPALDPQVVFEHLAEHDQFAVLLLMVNTVGLTDDESQKESIIVMLGEVVGSLFK